MIRRPPRSTQSRSSAASDVYKRQLGDLARTTHGFVGADLAALSKEEAMHALRRILPEIDLEQEIPQEALDKLQVNEVDFTNVQKNIEPSAMREVFVEAPNVKSVSYTHLRAHETRHDIV